MAADRDFSEGDDGGQEGVGKNDGISDGLWCQSNDSTNDHSWFSPDGQEVTSSRRGRSVTVRKSDSQVGLLHKNALSANEWGLYTCRISNQFGPSLSLIVWIGGEDVYDGEDGQRMTS